MTARLPARLHQVGQMLCIAASLAMLGLFFYTFFQRVDFAYDLEWMEGGMLLHGWRVTQGLSLYPEPSSEFIPFIYPPLYSWLLAAVGQVWSLDYAAGRWISCIGSISAAIAIVVAVRTERGNWGIAIAGAAFFLSFYEDTGSFMDLVRIDGIAMGLLAWSLVLVRRGLVMPGGILLCLAFMTKHNAAIFGLPCLWWLWRNRERKKAIHFVMWSALPALLFTALMQWKSHGFFLTYLLDVPRHHPFVPSRFFWGAFSEIGGGLLLILGLFIVAMISRTYRELTHIRLLVLLSSLVFVFLLLWQQEELVEWSKALVLHYFPQLPGKRGIGVTVFGIVFWIVVSPAIWAVCKLEITPNKRFWLLNGLVAIVFSAVMRGHHGGYTNVLMPGAWAYSLWAALLLVWFVEKSSLRWAGVLVGCAVVLQLWIGKWQPQSLIPNRADRQAAEKLMQMLQEVDGPIFAPHSPWYPVKLGKPSSTHLIAFWDIDHPGGPLEKYVDHIATDFASQKWSAILMSSGRFSNKKIQQLRVRFYPKRQNIHLPGKALMPKVGWRVRPRHLYFPK